MVFLGWSCSATLLMTYVLIRLVPAESITNPMTAERSAATTSVAAGGLGVVGRRWEKMEEPTRGQANSKSNGYNICGAPYFAPDASRVELDGAFGRAGGR